MSRNKKINIKMKNDLVLVSIFLTTILLINTAFSQNSGGAGIYWDHINKKLTLESTVVDPGPPPRTIPLQPATGQNMLDNPEDAYKHWDSATVQQRIDYVEKKFPGLKITGDVPNDFKLRPDGLFEYKGEIKNIDFNALIDKAGNVRIEFTNNGGNIKTFVSRFGVEFQYGEEVSLEVALAKMESLFPAEKPLQQPSSPYSSGPGNPDYGFAQGGGGSGGGGPEQLLSMIQKIADLAKVLRGNGGDTRVEEGQDGKIIAGMKNRAAISLEDPEDNGKSILLVAQNNEDEEAKLKEKGDKELTITNANVFIPDQLAASVDKTETTLFLNGIPGDYDGLPPQTDRGTQTLLTGISTTPAAPIIALNLPLINFINSFKITNFQSKLSATEFLARGLVTAQLINPQAIILEEDDLEKNGHNINSFALKTFNNLEAGGQDLYFSSGELVVGFNNQQTLVSRNLKKVPYGVKKISNKLDSRNKFTLQHYENRKGNFHNDNNEVQRTSLSDLSIEHPTIDGLIIWEERKKWWARN